MKLQENLSEFQRRGATLWAVSADPMDQAEALAKRLKLSFPLVADPELRLIRSFGVEMAGNPIAVPSTFVLEARTGRIAWRYIGESAFDRSDLQAILAAIDKTGARSATP